MKTSSGLADAVLVECYRVLLSGGVLLVTDLYLESAGDDQVPGQVTREQAEAMVRNAGFVIEHWEDRSNDLRQLAV